MSLLAIRLFSCIVFTSWFLAIRTILFMKFRIIHDTPFGVMPFHFLDIQKGNPTFSDYSTALSLVEDAYL